MDIGVAREITGLKIRMPQGSFRQKNVWYIETSDLVLYDESLCGGEKNP